MATTFIIAGLNSPLFITEGFSTIDPAPTPPVGGEQGAFLGIQLGYMTDSTTFTTLGIGVY